MNIKQVKHTCSEFVNLLFLGYICIFSSLYGSEVCTNFTETAYVTGSIGVGIDSAINHHFANIQTTDSALKPVEIWSDIGFTYDDIKTGHSKNGFAVLGMDFTYRDFLLKKVASGGLFLSCIEARSHYQHLSVDSQKLRAALFGAHGDFKYHKFVLSSSTYFGVGDTDAYISEDFDMPGKNIDTYSKDTLFMHSRSDLMYQMQCKKWRVCPLLGYRSDWVKMKKDLLFCSESMSANWVDGLAGVKIDYSCGCWYPLIFLGIEHRFSKNIPDRQVSMHGKSVHYKHTHLDRTSAVVTVELSYKKSEQLFFNINYSGRYSSHWNTSALSFGINKLF